VYTAEQIAIIADAVRAARAALQRARSDDPVLFARTYIAHDGVQIPGEPGAREAAGRLAERLMAALAEDESPAAVEEDLAVELRRVRAEAQLSRELDSAKVVGFRVELGAAAQQHPAAAALLGADFGLGAAVYPSTRVVVLPPSCLDYAYRPVLEDEVES